jgi:hypothetical protein
MFFYIGDDCPIKSMKQVEPRLFLDDGWNETSGIWYKGYSTDCVLSDSLISIVDGYQPAGKWCVIYKEHIYHPILRGFPVLGNDTCATNLDLEGLHPIKYKTVPITKQEILSIDEVSDQISTILVTNTENFIRYNDPKRISCIVSAGLDTLTSWVVLDQVIKEYDISIYVPTRLEKSTQEFLGTRRTYHTDLIEFVENKYWGYTHACFYDALNYNISGYYAEVYTYRDGEAINALAKFKNKTIDTLASPDDYLYPFLKRPNIVEKYRDSMLEFSSDEDLKRFLWSTIWYDHQMWHLDKNMFFCPFADIRIPELVHRMSIEDITHNAVTGQIQKNIINRLRPDLMCLLSEYKNEGDIWGNFKNNFNTNMVPYPTKLIYR